MRRRKKKSDPTAMIAASPPAKHKFPGKATGPCNIKRYTQAEVKKHLDHVEALMVLAVPNHSIRAQLARPVALGGLGVTKYWVDRLIARVLVQWEENQRANSNSKRTSAEMRIIRQIQNCQGKRSPDGQTWLERPNHHALRGYEQILMKLQGTAMPEQVDINVRFTETMSTVWQRYDLAMLEKLHAAAQAKKRLAAAYVEEHPEAAEIIDAEGVTVE